MAGALGQRLAEDLSIEIASEGAQTWILLLAQSNAYPRWAEMLGRVLVRAAKQGLWPLAMRLLRQLCEPSINIERQMPFQPGDMALPVARPDVWLAGGSTYLMTAWEECFKPVLKDLGRELLNIFEQAIRDSHHLAVAFGQANRHSDPLIITRSRIEANAAHPDQNEFGWVITWFCEVVAEEIKRSSGLSLERIEEWLVGQVPVLYRVGLYALNLLPTLSSSQKLEWLLRWELLYKSVIGARHELFAVLKAVYNGLNEFERSKLWQNIEAGPPPDWLNFVEDVEKRERLRQTETDRLVWFLAKSHPGDPQALAAFNRLEIRSPEFANANHEHVDFDFWSSGIQEGHKSPLTVDQLLGRNPGEQLDYLLNYQGTDPIGESREGLLADGGRGCSSRP